MLLETTEQGTENPFPGRGVMRREEEQCAQRMGCTCWDRSPAAATPFKYVSSTEVLLSLNDNPNNCVRKPL